MKLRVLFRYETRDGKQGDGNKLRDGRERVPERLVVLLGEFGGSRGEEGLACDEEGGDEQEDIHAVGGANLVARGAIAAVWGVVGKGGGGEGRHTLELGAREEKGLEEDEDGAHEEDVNGDLAEGVSGAYGGWLCTEAALHCAGDAEGDGGDEGDAEEKAEAEETGDGPIWRVLCEGYAAGE